MTYRVFRSHFLMMNSIVVHGPEGSVIIDPGAFADEVAAIGVHALSGSDGDGVSIAYTHFDYDHIIDPDFDGSVPVRRFAGAAAASRDPEGILKAWERADGAFYMERTGPRRIPTGVEWLHGGAGTLTAGGFPIEYLHVPGHTIDSMVYRIPDLGLVMAGDMLSDMEPPSIGCTPGEYADSLDLLGRCLGQWGPGVVVPGHGRPCGGDGWRRRLDTDMAYLMDLGAAALTVANGGRTMEEALGAVGYDGAPVPPWHAGTHAGNLAKCLEAITGGEEGFGGPLG